MNYVLDVMESLTTFPSSSVEEADIHMKLIHASRSHLRRILQDEEGISATALSILFNDTSIISLFDTLLHHYDMKVDRSLPSNCPSKILEIIKILQKLWRIDEDRLSEGGEAGNQGISAALIYDALHCYQIRKMNYQIGVMQHKSNEKNVLHSISVDEHPNLLKDLQICLLEEQIDLLWCLQRIASVFPPHPLASPCNKLTHQLIAQHNIHHKLWDTFIAFNTPTAGIQQFNSSSYDLLQNAMDKLRNTLILQAAIINCLWTLSTHEECNKYILENAEKFLLQFMDDIFVGVANVIAQENPQLLSSQILMHNAQELASVCVLFIVSIHEIREITTGTTFRALHRVMEDCLRRMESGSRCMGVDAAAQVACISNWSSVLILFGHAAAIRKSLPSLVQEGGCAASELESFMSSLLPQHCSFFASSMQHFTNTREFLQPSEKQMLDANNIYRRRKVIDFLNRVLTSLTPTPFIPCMELIVQSLCALYDVASFAEGLWLDAKQESAFYAILQIYIENFPYGLHTCTELLAGLVPHRSYSAPPSDTEEAANNDIGRHDGNRLGGPHGSAFIILLDVLTRPLPSILLPPLTSHFEPIQPDEETLRFDGQRGNHELEAGGITQGGESMYLWNMVPSQYRTTKTTWIELCVLALMGIEGNRWNVQTILDNPSNWSTLPSHSQGIVQAVDELCFSSMQKLRLNRIYDSGDSSMNHLWTFSADCQEVKKADAESPIGYFNNPDKGTYVNPYTESRGYTPAESFGKPLTLCAIAWPLQQSDGKPTILRFIWFLWDALILYMKSTGEELPPLALKMFAAATTLMYRLARWNSSIRIILEMVVAKDIYNEEGLNPLPTSASSLLSRFISILMLSSSHSSLKSLLPDVIDAIRCCMLPVDVLDLQKLLNALWGDSQSLHSIDVKSTTLNPEKHLSASPHLLQLYWAFPYILQHSQAHSPSWTLTSSPFAIAMETILAVLEQHERGIQTFPVTRSILLLINDWLAMCPPHMWRLPWIVHAQLSIQITREYISTLRQKDSGDEYLLLHEWIEAFNNGVTALPNERQVMETSVEHLEMLDAICHFMLSSVWGRMASWTFCNHSERLALVLLIIRVVRKLVSCFGVFNLPPLDGGDDAENKLSSNNQFTVDEESMRLTSDVMYGNAQICNKILTHLSDTNFPASLFPLIRCAFEVSNLHKPSEAWMVAFVNPLLLYTAAIEQSTITVCHNPQLPPQKTVHTEETPSRFIHKSNKYESSFASTDTTTSTLRWFSHWCRAPIFTDAKNMEEIDNHRPYVYTANSIIHESLQLLLQFLMVVVEPTCSPLFYPLSDYLLNCVGSYPTIYEGGPFSLSLSSTELLLPAEAVYDDPLLSLQSRLLQDVLLEKPQANIVQSIFAYVGLNKLTITAIHLLSVISILLKREKRHDPSTNTRQLHTSFSSALVDISLELAAKQKLYDDDNLVDKLQNVYSNDFFDNIICKIYWESDSTTMMGIKVALLQFTLIGIRSFPSLLLDRNGAYANTSLLKFLEDILCQMTMQWETYESLRVADLKVIRLALLILEELVYAPSNALKYQIGGYINSGAMQLFTACAMYDANQAKFYDTDKPKQKAATKTKGGWIVLLKILKRCTHLWKHSETHMASIRSTNKSSKHSAEYESAFDTASHLYESLPLETLSDFDNLLASSVAVDAVGSIVSLIRLVSAHVRYGYPSLYHNFHTNGTPKMSIPADKEFLEMYLYITTSTEMSDFLCPSLNGDKDGVFSGVVPSVSDAQQLHTLDEVLSANRIQLQLLIPAQQVMNGSTNAMGGDATIDGYMQHILKQRLLQNAKQITIARDFVKCGSAVAESNDIQKISSHQLPMMLQRNLYFINSTAQFGFEYLISHPSLEFMWIHRLAYRMSTAASTQKILFEYNEHMRLSKNASLSESLIDSKAILLCVLHQLLHWSRSVSLYPLYYPFREAPQPTVELTTPPPFGCLTLPTLSTLNYILEHRSDILERGLYLTCLSAFSSTLLSSNWLTDLQVSSRWNDSSTEEVPVDNLRCPRLIPMEERPLSKAVYLRAVCESQGIVDRCTYTALLHRSIPAGSLALPSGDLIKLFEDHSTARFTVEHSQKLLVHLLKFISSKVRVLQQVCSAQLDLQDVHNVGVIRRCTFWDYVSRLHGPTHATKEAANAGVNSSLKELTENDLVFILSLLETVHILIAVWSRLVLPGIASTVETEEDCESSEWKEVHRIIEMTLQLAANSCTEEIMLCISNWLRKKRVDSTVCVVPLVLLSLPHVLLSASTTLAENAQIGLHKLGSAASMHWVEKELCSASEHVLQRLLKRFSHDVMNVATMHSWKQTLLDRLTTNLGSSHIWSTTTHLLAKPLTINKGIEGPRVEDLPSPPLDICSTLALFAALAESTNGALLLLRHSAFTRLSLLPAVLEYTTPLATRPSQSYDQFFPSFEGRRNSILGVHDTAETVLGPPLTESLWKPVYVQEDATTVQQPLIYRAISHVNFCKVLQVMAQVVAQLRTHQSTEGDKLFETYGFTEYADAYEEILKWMHSNCLRIYFVLTEGCKAGQMALLEESTLYMRILSCLPKHSELRQHYQQFVWAAMRWSQGCVKDYCRLIDKGLVDCGELIKPLSSLERQAASVLSVTADYFVPTVPSIFHQRSIFLMLSVVNCFIKAVFHLEISRSVDEYLPPSEDAFLPSQSSQEDLHIAPTFVQYHDVVNLLAFGLKEISFVKSAGEVSSPTVEKASSKYRIKLNDSHVSHVYTHRTDIREAASIPCTYSGVSAYEREAHTISRDTPATNELHSKEKVKAGSRMKSHKPTLEQLLSMFGVAMDAAKACVHISEELARTERHVLVAVRNHLEELYIPLSISLVCSRAIKPNKSVFSASSNKHRTSFGSVGTAEVNSPDTRSVISQSYTVIAQKNASECRSRRGYPAVECAAVKRITTGDNELACTPDLIHFDGLCILLRDIMEKASAFGATVFNTLFLQNQLHEHSDYVRRFINFLSLMENNRVPSVILNESSRNIIRSTMEYVQKTYNLAEVLVESLPAGPVCLR